VSLSDEQVLTLLRSNAGAGADGASLSVQAAARAGRWRVVRRRGAQLAGAAAATAGVVVAVSVLPGLLDRPEPAAPGATVTADPSENPVRRLYAAYDDALTRVGLPVGDPSWTRVYSFSRVFDETIPADGMQAMGELDAITLTTVRIDPARQPAVGELCALYADRAAEGMVVPACEETTNAAGEAMTLLSDPGGTGAVRAAAVWWGQGVVLVGQGDSPLARAVTEEQLVELASDPSLRW
jgi:hypothetical protein